MLEVWPEHPSPPLKLRPRTRNNALRDPDYMAACMAAASLCAAESLSAATFFLLMLIFNGLYLAEPYALRVAPAQVALEDLLVDDVVVHGPERTDGDT